MNRILIILLALGPQWAFGNSERPVKYYEKNFVHLQIPADYFCMPEVPLNEDGIAVYYNEQKKKIQEVPCNRQNKVDGTLKNFLPTGELVESIEFKNGERSGAHRKYTGEGKVRQETYFSNGKPDGIHRLFDANGQLLELGHYEDGKRVGKFTIQTPEGVKLVKEYKNGVQVSEPSYEYKDISQALFLAASSGHPKTIKELLKKGAPANVENRWGTPLTLAAQYDRASSITALVEGGANIDLLTKANGQSALMTAARLGKMASLLELIRLKAKIDLKDAINGDTALTLAGMNGHIPIVLKLIEKGANTKTRNKKGKTPAKMARMQGQTDIADILDDPAKAIIKFEKQQTEHFCKNSRLDMFASRNEESVVRDWVEKCSATDADKSIRSRAMRAAAQHGHYDLVKFLFTQGADPNSTEKNGPTALIWAAMNGHYKTVRLLLANGADLNVQDDFGSTALIWASERGHIEIVEHLVNQGAKLNLRNKDGKSALFSAVEAGQASSVQLLLARGAVAERSFQGETPMEVAKREGYNDIVRILATAGE